MRAAFDSMITDRKAELFGAAFGVTRNPHDAEDAVQEAVFTGFQKLEQCRSVDTLPGWLLTITLNAARRIMALRQRQLPAVDLGELDRALPELAAPGGGAAPDLDRYEAVQEAYQALDEGELSLILQHYGEKKSTGEIAQLRGVPEPTLIRHMASARDKLVDPLARKAMRVLSEIYGQTFGPSLLARTQLIPMQVAHQAAGRVFVLASVAGTHGVLVTTDEAVESRAATSPPASLVLDKTNLFAPTAFRLSGDDIRTVAWNLGLAEALGAGHGVSITHGYYEAYMVGSACSLDRLIEICDQVADHLQREDRGAEIERCAAQLGSGEPEAQLAAASALLKMGIGEPVVETLAGLNFGTSGLEARRAAAVGYAAKLRGDVELAVECFARSCRAHKANWEWHYHLAEAHALSRQYAEAATAVVWTLKKDRKGKGHAAIRGNPELRALLAIPRLWQLLPARSGPVLPTDTFLPGLPLDNCIWL